MITEQQRNHGTLQSLYKQINELPRNFQPSIQDVVTTRGLGFDRITSRLYKLMKDHTA